jgi:hypothetical protein
MDFVIKSMQLSVEKFIIARQQRNNLPSCTVIFVDLTNMFNAVSCKELFDLINKDFSELSGLMHLLSPIAEMFSSNRTRSPGNCYK